MTQTLKIEISKNIISNGIIAGINPIAIAKQIAIELEKNGIEAPATPDNYERLALGNREIIHLFDECGYLLIGSTTNFAINEDFKWTLRGK